MTFQWSPGSATAYSILVGSSPGAFDIYTLSNTKALTTTVNNMPTDGRTVYVQLYSKIGTSWTSNSYTYTAFGP